MIRRETGVTGKVFESELMVVLVFDKTLDLLNRRCGQVADFGRPQGSCEVDHFAEGLCLLFFDLESGCGRPCGLKQQFDAFGKIVVGLVHFRKHGRTVHVHVAREEIGVYVECRVLKMLALVGIAGMNFAGVDKQYFTWGDAEPLLLANTFIYTLVYDHDHVMIVEVRLKRVIEIGTAGKSDVREEVILP